jgi:hypothetical protein
VSVTNLKATLMAAPDAAFKKILAAYEKRQSFEGAAAELGVGMRSLKRWAVDYPKLGAEMHKMRARWERERGGE